MGAASTAWVKEPPVSAVVSSILRRVTHGVAAIRTFLWFRSRSHDAIRSTLDDQQCVVAQELLLHRATGNSQHSDVSSIFRLPNRVVHLPSIIATGPYGIVVV